jgi:DNA-binding response OmpR family regulator
LEHILIIEDDPAIAFGIQTALQEENLRVTIEHNGSRGFELALNGTFDCIVLDVMLPSMNGRDVCRRLRSEGLTAPIIMLTSKGEEADKVLGLELGADDYVTKPFSTRELIARVKSQLRRAAKPKSKGVSEVSFGRVVVDFSKRFTTMDGVPVKLSAREYDVLRYLVEHEGNIVTREMLLDDVWGYDTFPTTRTVDNYILMLRKKLEHNPSTPQHILTFHTLGYKFVKG